VTRFRWGTATDVGRVRNVNQDSSYSVEGFFAVADGMGGHRGGEVASAVALQSLSASLPVLSTDDLLDAISESNLAVLDRANGDPSLRGMGTTLCVLALVDDGDGEPALILANVGDSRIYQYGSGVLEQRTDDHSMVAEMLRQGRLTAEEAGVHPQRNILTRALGIDAAVQIDAWRVAPAVGQRWMLCSDGLFNEVGEDALASVLGSVGDPTEAASELVRLANEGGGRDNITVLVVDVIDDLGHAVPAPSGAVTVIDVHETGDPTTPHRVVTVAAPAVHEAPPSPGRVSPARRARDAWRVVLFAFAFIAVAVVALISWLVLRDDGPTDPEPPGGGVTTTTEVSATTTTAPAATTTKTEPATSGSN
jgi:serine/threonine protein phosphatase PrpC